MQIIKSIQIRKFRSIKSLTRDLMPSHLNIFVGQNDKGKSNILRALNLFFNNETDAGQAFRFEDDYCYHADTGTGTRREIRIDLEIDPPRGRFKHAKPLRWTKHWKRDGSIIQERVVIETGEKLSASNNVSKWLDKLRYRYVPAIKGKDYFTILMGELHDVLNEAHRDVLAHQGEEFITGIQQVTNEITSELQGQIGIANTIQVPSDFRSLFSNLDFGSRIDGNTYHLKQRGDGIKVRHIPVILKYMSDEEKNISIPGYVKPDTIWGFEEPENNLELRYAFELAKTFKDYSREIQIFITTHSPAFYALDETEQDGVNTFYVSQDEANCTLINRVTHEDTDDLHDKMGLLPIITPYLTEIYNRDQEIEQLVNRVNQLQTTAACFVLTEDEDQDFIKKYFEVNGFNLAETEFISYSGADQIDASMVVANYLAEKWPNAAVVIHRDRDYLTDEKIAALRGKISRNGYSFYVTRGVDVEGQFVNAAHVTALYPAISIRDAEAMIEQATQEAEEDSVNRLIDQYFKNEKPVNQAYARKFWELRQQYLGNRERYRYGKKVFGLLKSKIQRNIRANPDLLRHSPHIVDQDLSEISLRVWPLT